MLWLTAWRQTPCGTLPSDDTLIAVRIGMPLAHFVANRHILLRGWHLHADGRLYHETITQIVLAMLATKAKDATRKADWRARQSSGVTPESRGTDDGQTGQSTVGDDTGTSTGTSTTTSLHSVVAPNRKRSRRPAADAATTTRASRLAKDWKLPKSWGDWAIEKYPHWTADKVRDEATKFRNHWTSKSGKDATKLDWYATWQNWCMSELAHRDDPRPGPAGGSAAPTPKETSDFLRGMDARARDAVPPPKHIRDLVSGRHQAEDAGS